MQTKNVKLTRKFQQNSCSTTRPWSVLPQKLFYYARGFSQNFSPPSKWSCATKSKILEIFPPAAGRTWNAVIQNQVTEDSAGADPTSSPKGKALGTRLGRIQGRRPRPSPPLFLDPFIFVLRHSLVRSFYFIQVYVFIPLIHNSLHSYAFHTFWFTPIFYMYNTTQNIFLFRPDDAAYQQFKALLEQCFTL